MEATKKKCPFMSDAKTAIFCRDDCQIKIMGVQPYGNGYALDSETEICAFKLIAYALSGLSYKMAGD